MKLWQMIVNRSAILRDAHSRTRQLQLGERYVRPSWRVWPTYKAAFAFALREAWAVAKANAVQAERAAALAAEEAASELPAEVQRQMADLWMLAGVQLLTSSGAAQFRSLYAEADDIAQAARCAMIPALQDTQHVAH